MSNQNPDFQKVKPRQKYSYRWQTRRFSSSEYHSLIGTINSSLASLGFAPHSQGDFLFVYEKEEKPDGCVFLLLLLLWILPGILYLLFGHSKSVVSIQVFGTDKNYIFDVSAPGYALVELDRIFSQFNSATPSQYSSPSQYSLMPSVKETAKPKDTKACPFCAETIKAEAIKCKHCGSMLDGSE